MNDEPQLASPLAMGAGPEAPTEHLVSGTVGDRCVSCGTPLSSDQRYCVTCGERRGKARFALPAFETAAPQGPAPPLRAPRTTRASSGATLIAGVGTLLLAMGVGVLIGRDSANNVNGRPVQAAAPTVVTVGTGAGSGSGTAAPTGSGKAGRKASKSKSKSGTKSKSAAKPTAAQAKKASAAASKVLGSGAKNLPPPTVTNGSKGHGPGYNKSGKFDGSFFGQ
jgi:hypothetical protein